MTDPKPLPHPHEINILKNVVEKSEGVSERLKKWAEELIHDIEDELRKLEGEKPATALTAKPVANAPYEQGASVRSVASAADAPSSSEPTASEDGEEMTVDEMRATGHYTEQQIQELCQQHGVPYTPVPDGTLPTAPAGTLETVAVDDPDTSTPTA